MKNAESVLSEKIKEQSTNGTPEASISENSRQMLMHHLSSFQENDLEAVMSDYTNESIFITQLDTFKGLEEIKAFFAGLMIHFPKEQSSFELDKIVVEGKLGFIAWHAKTPSLHVPLGSDTFIIKDDKIYQQTFVGQMEFIK